MSATVYFISGLGADKRVFSLLDLSFCNPVFIDWIKPNKNEQLEKYAQRLREQIPDAAPTVIGISLGGMLVTEMAKANPSMKGIIISSNKTASEFPTLLRTAKYFPLYKWLPRSLFKRIMLANRFMLGGKDKNKKKILREIIQSTDINFTKWAIHAILNWKNRTSPTNIIHIHGTADRLLPLRLLKADFTIPSGSHVMTMDNHEEISALLRKLIHPL